MNGKTFYLLGSSEGNMSKNTVVTHPYLLERLRNNEISDRTAKYNQEMLERLARFAKVDVKETENLPETLVVDYLISVGHLEGKTLVGSATSHNVNMVFLKRFYADHNKTYFPKRKKLHIDDEAPKFDSQAIDSLFKACRNDRDRIMIAVFIETGFRLGELASVTLGDIEEDPKTGGLIIHCTISKTKKRGVLILESAAKVRRWCNIDHPRALDKTAKLLCVINDCNGEPVGTDMNEEMIYHAFDKVRRRAIHNAGENPNLTREIKRIHPHAMRHIATTNDVKAGIPEALIKVRRGWTKDSKMIARYTHVDEDDSHAAYANSKGIKNKEIDPLEPPRVCPRCNRLNSAMAQYCDACASPLDLKAAQLLGEKKTELAGMAHDPELLEAIIEKVKADLKKDPEFRKELQKKA